MTQLTTRINGAQYHEGAQTRLNTMRRGERVALVREPDCPQDFRAIQCWSTDGVMLGYVAAKDNLGPSAAMDRGDEVVCEIAVNQPMIRVSWPSLVSLAEGAKLRGIVRGA